MGEEVDFNAGTPGRPNATPSQALFNAILESFKAEGMPIPRAQVAIAVRQGAPSLTDGVEPQIVLSGCVTALRRGKPELASKIILDISLAISGLAMNTHEYNRELARITSANDPVQQRFKAAMAEINARRSQ